MINLVVMTIVKTFSHIGYLFRLVATFCGFSFFGVGALVLAFIWFPILCLIWRDKEKRRVASQASIKHAFQLFLVFSKWCGLFNYQFSGLEKLKSDTGCLLIANHPSLIDYVLLASVMPRCDCIVKAQVFKNFFFKRVVKAAGYIPNNGSEELLKNCAIKLQEGGILLIFPEGTRSTYNQTIKIQRGTAQLALRTAADIRVAHINCSAHFLSKETKWYNVPRNVPTFRVSIGDKISIADYLNSKQELPIIARQLTRKITEEISQ